MDGLLLFNKPILWTSHDVVDFVRRRIGQQAVGHAGTLDPMATGLLLILLGKWTKKSEELMGLAKGYEGTIRLGVQTDSYDLDGRIESFGSHGDFGFEEVSSLFSSMTGKISQTPPVYSALKLNGKKFYDLARQGVAVAPKPREVEVSEFVLNYIHEAELGFRLSCSKGTYVRSIAHEVGRRLGCGATLSCLVRTRIGNFNLSSALNQTQLIAMTMDKIEKSLLR